MLETEIIISAYTICQKEIVNNKQTFLSKTGLDCLNTQFQQRKGKSLTSAKRIIFKVKLKDIYKQEVDN